jgi:hypothetical protein
VLAGTSPEWFCLPLFMNLRDGVKTILRLEMGNTESDRNRYHIAALRGKILSKLEQAVHNEVNLKIWVSVK